MLYLALSCLQGRPMQKAAEFLISLGINKLQLTPGNAPTENFQYFLTQNAIDYTIHHGFAFDKIRTPIWSANADCLVKADSIHPPLLKQKASLIWPTRAEQGDYQDLVIETMHPGYLLGSGAELEWAMNLGLKLAIDVSHIYIQLYQNIMDRKTWQKIQNYENIYEIHISSNQGKADTHQPLEKNSFGLAWAKERALDTIPLVLECYMHRLSFEQCQKQIILAQLY